MALAGIVLVAEAVLLVGVAGDGVVLLESLSFLGGGGVGRRATPLL